jgi:hypothetical protein
MGKVSNQTRQHTSFSTTASAAAEGVAELGDRFITGALTVPPYDKGAGNQAWAFGLR